MKFGIFKNVIAIRGFIDKRSKEHIFKTTERKIAYVVNILSNKCERRRTITLHSIANEQTIFVDIINETYFVSSDGFVYSIEKTARSFYS